MTGIQSPAERTHAPQSVGSESDCEAVLDIIRRRQGPGRALLHRIVGPHDLELRSEGSWIYGLGDRPYLDFGSFAVFLLGHRHPAVIGAVRDQLDRMALSARTFASPVVAAALEAIASTSPPGLTKVMLLNTGADAVEAAIKLARLTTGRRGLVHLTGSFHGKTAGALSITDSPFLRQPFLPLLGDVSRAPRDSPDDAAAVVEQKKPGAVFVEAIQGEGGIYELSAPLLQALRAACDNVGALLIADEIQCGLGRSGAMWAVENSGIVPDVLLMGKALGGGVLPASAVVATPEAFAPFNRDPMLHTSTFASSPIAAAAVDATIRVIFDEDVPARSARAGFHLRSILDDAANVAPEAIVGIRGRGLMLGIECSSPSVAGDLLRSCAHSGVLLTPCLSAPHILRVLPSAFVSDSELSYARTALMASADEVANSIRAATD